MLMAGLVVPITIYSISHIDRYLADLLTCNAQHPPTVIRAMVMRECGLEGGMKGTMYRALRERKQEINIAAQIRGEPPGDGQNGMEQGHRAGTHSRRATTRCMVPRTRYNGRRREMPEVNGPVADMESAVGHTHSKNLL